MIGLTEVMVCDSILSVRAEFKSQDRLGFFSLELLITYSQRESGFLHKHVIELCILLNLLSIFHHHLTL